MKAGSWYIVSSQLRFLSVVLSISEDSSSKSNDFKLIKYRYLNKSDNKYYYADSAILQYSPSTANKPKATIHQIKYKLIQDHIHSLQLCNVTDIVQEAHQNLESYWTYSAVAV